MTIVQAIADPAPESPRSSWSRPLETAAFILLVAILAWAPFPLGSNRGWSWSLLALLVALCWSVWSVSCLIAPRRKAILPRALLVPLLLAVSVLLWAFVQILPIMPTGLAHPLWGIASDTLGIQLGQRISIDPWRTGTELMKLLTYLVVAVLAFVLSHRSERAGILLIAILAIITFYAAYGLILKFSGFSQTEIFYPTWHFAQTINGPFVGRNNYATYLGMGVIIAAVQIYPAGSKAIVTGRGFRQYSLSTIQFLFGEGIWGIIAFGAILSILAATGSRAGFLAMVVGLITMLALSIPLATRRSSSRWAILGVCALALIAFSLFSLSGTTLESRFFELVEAGGMDQVRAMLWEAASRMIADSPLMGLGLGTFERAYPLYAESMVPFVMDKTHNDYLEFAAGIGLPAAIAWWVAIGWCVWLCIRGVFIRRRDRIYPMMAVGVTALVAFHSVFDFSLQIPAVAITYAAILGLGVAQAFSTRQP